MLYDCTVQNSSCHRPVMPRSFAIAVPSTRRFILVVRPEVVLGKSSYALRAEAPRLSPGAIFA
jgi:hypothetical protein